MAQNVLLNSLGMTKSSPATALHIFHEKSSAQLKDHETVSGSSHFLGSIASFKVSLLLRAPGSIT